MHPGRLGLTSQSGRPGAAFLGSCIPHVHTATLVHVPLIRSVLLHSVGPSVTCMVHAYQYRLVPCSCMRGLTFAPGSSIHHPARVDAPTYSPHPYVRKSSSLSVLPPSAPHASVYQPTLVQPPCMLPRADFSLVDLYLPMHDDHHRHYTVYHLIL
jgi:hypothetical protein